MRKVTVVGPGLQRVAGGSLYLFEVPIWRGAGIEKDQEWTFPKFEFHLRS